MPELLGEWACGYHVVDWLWDRFFPFVRWQNQIKVDEQRESVLCRRSLSSKVEMLWFRVGAQPSFRGNNKAPIDFCQDSIHFHSDWTEIHVGAALRTFGVMSGERVRETRCTLMCDSWLYSVKKQAPCAVQHAWQQNSISLHLWAMQIKFNAFSDEKVPFSRGNSYVFSSFPFF
jgi:hypothetical protein